MRCRGAGGCLNFRRRRARPPAGNVGEGSVFKNHRILPDIGEGIAQAFQAEVADIHTIQQNAPFGHIIKPRHECKCRGFPRTGWPDKRHCLARFGSETEARKCCIRHAFIAEADRIKGYAPAARRQRHRGCGADDLARCINHAEYARQASKPFLQG